MAESMKTWDEFLADVAHRILYEMAKELLYSAKGANVDAAKAQLELDRKVVAAVLRRKVLPLLEAGEAMRGNVESRFGIMAGERWDAAKKQAMEG